MKIRPASSKDAAEIAGIYNHYIATSHATFEVDLLDVDEMAHRVEAGLAAGYPFFVCEENALIIGYAFGHQFRQRRAYQRSIEVSVYIKPGHQRKNIGTILYDELFKTIRTAGFHAIIAGISLPNDGSVRLHEKFGFEKVAHFREVGRKFERWIDVGYWELIVKS